MKRNRVKGRRSFFLGFFWPCLVTAGGLVTLGLALYWGETVWWILCCFLLAVTVTGMGYTLLGRCCIRVGLEKATLSVRRTEPCHAAVQVTWRFPLLWSGFRLWYEWDDGDRKTWSDCSVPPPGFRVKRLTRRMALPLETHYKGIYQICLVRAELRDVFGIFRWKLPLHSSDERVTLTVYPRTDLSLESRVDSCLQEGIVSDHREWEVNLSGENRPYQQGDSLRRVNWKLTARRGEVYVKKQEAESDGGFHLYLAAIPSASQEADLEQLALDQAASLAAQVMEKGSRIHVYQGLSALPSSFGGAEGMDAFLQYLLLVKLGGSTSPMGEAAALQEALPRLRGILLPSNAPDEVVETALSMNRGSLLMVNGPLDPFRLERWKSSADQKGIVLIHTEIPQQERPVMQEEGFLC